MFYCVYGQMSEIKNYYYYYKNHLEYCSDMNIVDAKVIYIAGDFM